MSNTLTGAIIHIGEVEQVSEKFSKRILVIKTNEQYPQEVPFELVNGATGNTDGFSINDAVEVSFNVRGRKGQSDKWYSSLNAWKLIKK